MEHSALPAIMIKAVPVHHRMISAISFLAQPAQGHLQICSLTTDEWILDTLG